MRDPRTQRGFLEEEALSWTLKESQMPRGRDIGKGKAETAGVRRQVLGTAGMQEAAGKKGRPYRA